MRSNGLNMLAVRLERQLATAKRDIDHLDAKLAAWEDLADQWHIPEEARP